MIITKMRLPGGRNVIPASEPRISRVHSDISANDFVIPENDFVIPENDFVIPENDFVIPENDFVIPENDFVIPAQAGIQSKELQPMERNLVYWIPACAGMTA